MIASLRGAVRRQLPPEVHVEASGVGYRVLASMALLRALPADGEEAQLAVQLVVRDDAHTLYGFADEAERLRFCRLLQVPGVGAKTALGIVSALPGEALSELLRAGDEKALTRVPGIGTKTARRLLVELKTEAPGAAAAGTPPAEAAEALVRLGWKTTEARRMVAALDCAGKTAEELLAEALRGVGP